MPALLAAAIGAATFLFRAFLQNGTPPALMLMMTAWVMAPFGIFLAANALSTRWPLRTRDALHRGILIASLAALAIYAFNAARPFSNKAAAIFVAVPPASLVLAGSIFAQAMLLRRR